MDTGPAPRATVVVTARDRWDHAATNLHTLLARTDPGHRIVVVDGAAPTDVASSFDRMAATGRIDLIRRDRYLASNEGRRLAVDAGVDTDWIAFVENDAMPSQGWLETLIARAEATGARSAFPVYLQDTPAGRLVHGAGADLEVTHHPAGRRVREIHHHLHEPWSDAAHAVVEAPRVQAEPHCLVIRRDFLETTGGPDPDLLGWFEHLDLALHHLEAGEQCRFVPEVTCLYAPPLRLRPRETPTFLLRWGRGWFDHSRRRMCQLWDLDPDDPMWSIHDRYRTDVRRGVMTRGRHRVNRAIDVALAPAGRLVEGRWFRARQRDEPPAPRAPRASRP